MVNDTGCGPPRGGQVQLVFHALARTLRAHELASLSTEERARAARFAFERDRARFVSGRHRLRELLGARLGLAPAAVPLVLQAQGKPVLAGTATLHFNLSHSQGLALYAFGSDGPLGVDIEQVQPQRDLPGLARTVFSPAELAAWRALPAAQQPLAFTTLWARKEALLKALGTGLTLEPATLHLGLHLGLHSGRYVDQFVDQHVDPHEDAQTLALDTPGYCGPAHVYTVPATAPFAAALASLQPVRQWQVLVPQPETLET